MINPQLLIPKYINRLNLGIEIERQTIEMVRKYINGQSISGKDPKGICAGAIYLASRLESQSITQAAVSEVTGITQVTLRSRYKELMRFLKLKPTSLPI